MQGLWDGWHRDAEPVAYGDTVTYEMAWEWLQDCPLVEDWGCGPGWSRRYFRAGQWRGVDGSQSPAVHELVDLRAYRTWVPGILMRHVLEHNMEWERVLDNALASFSHRMVLVLFTPMMEETRTIAWNPVPGVPDISFAARDIESRFPSRVDFQKKDLSTKTQYGVERIYFLQKG